MELFLPRSYCDDPLFDPRLPLRESCTLSDVTLPTGKRPRDDDTDSWNDPLEENHRTEVNRREHSASPQPEGLSVVHVCGDGRPVPPRRSSHLRHEPKRVASSTRQWVSYKYDDLPASLCRFLEPHTRPARFMRQGSWSLVQVWMPTLKRHHRLAMVDDSRVGALLLAAATLDVELRERFAASEWLHELVDDPSRVSQWILTLDSV